MVDSLFGPPTTGTPASAGWTGKVLRADDASEQVRVPIQNGPSRQPKNSHEQKGFQKWIDHKGMLPCFLGKG